MYTIALLFLCVLSANGHSYFSSITIDGVARAEDDCIRPHPSSRYDYPISEKGRPNGLTSNDMTCGWLPAASNPANRKCPVNPGSQITIQWHYERNLGTSDTFIIDPSHKGPCLVYMAKSESGSGPVWFKIFEDGYDRTTKKWCVDKLRANGGKLQVTIPTDIAPGNYLFRSELIALHEGDKLYGAQPYIGCAELTVGGSGTVDPPNKVSIPGVYTATDPGIYFDIYTGSNPAYPIPGPALYISAAASGTTPTPSPTPSVPVTTSKVTSGRSTTSKVTTGRSSTTANSAAASTTAKLTTGIANTVPATTGSVNTIPATTGSATTPTGPCVLGEQQCLHARRYRTCVYSSRFGTKWSDSETCPRRKSCQQINGNKVACS